MRKAEGQLYPCHFFWPAVDLPLHSRQDEPLHIFHYRISNDSSKNHIKHHTSQYV